MPTTGPPLAQRAADLRGDETGAGGPVPRLSRAVVVVALAAVALLLSVAGRYGYHRDEMYFIVAGGHPAFGYPDQPPLVPLLMHAMQWLAPGSLLALRSPSAVSAGATIVVAGLIARELGGARAAQTVAAASTAVTAILLATGHFVTTTTFDVLSTTVVAWLVLRGLVRRRGGALLAAGVVAGLGALAKPQVLLVYGVLLGSLLLVGPRWPLRSRGLWTGTVAAVVLVAPYVVWQATHGWPQLTVAANIAGSAEGGRAGFVPFQLVLVSPVLVPVWVAGLVRAWRDRTLRVVPVTYGLLAVAYLAGDGKAYYLAGLYPLLLGVGAISTVSWIARGRRRVRVALVVAALATSAVVNSLIGLPLLPAHDLQGTPALALNPDLGETVGWPAFLSAVAEAWRQVPEPQRDHTVIFTRNYGEASAIDLFGPGHGLPAAYSGHNGFSEWARPQADRTAVVVVGFDGPADAAPYFTGCRRLVTVTNPDGVHNQEYGGPVLYCTHLRSGWATLWPSLRHYN
jgi:4-amino-4-deoxy-L-arabinose transferase-like glycosyltransferase